MDHGTAWWLLLALATAGYGLAALVPWALGTGDTRIATVPYHAAVLALSVGLLVWSVVERRTVRADLPLALLAGFAVLYTARVAVETLSAPASLRLPAPEYWLYWLGTIVVPGAAIMALVRRATLRKAGRVLLGLFFAVVVLAFLYRSAAPPAALTGEARRVGAPGMGGIWFGHFGVSLYLLGLASLYASVREGEVRSARWLFPLAAAFVGLAALVASESRGPALAALAATLFLAACGGLTRRSLVATVTVILATGLLAGGVAALGLADPFLRRVEFMGQVVGYGRIDLYLAGLREFAAHPFLGSSLEFGLSVPDTRYPHNLIIEALMSTGAFGGAALAAALAVYLWRGRRIGSRDPRLAWIGALFTQYLVAAMFSGAIYTNQYTWMTLAAVVAADQSLRQGEAPAP